MTRRRAAMVLVALVALAAAAFVARRNPHGANAAPATTVTTAKATRANLTATQLVNATLGFAPSPPVIVRRRGTYTALPAEGALIQAGQAVAFVDDRPVVLLLGATGAWRPFALGMTDGPDVAQLEQGLVDLGYGTNVTVDNHFTATTAVAIRRWQTDLGETATGTVEDGDVVFLPAPLRVGTANAAVGASVHPDEAPYAATSTTRVVQADLDAARQQGISVGTAVTVDLSGGGRATGKVSALGRVATVANNISSNVGSGRPTVPLTIALDDPSIAGELDQQPVQVEFVTESRTNVLAVPVTALLALAEGGYGVEVVPATGPHSIVRVTPGLFASGLVEITSGAITEETVVVVAR